MPEGDEEATRELAARAIADSLPFTADAMLYGTLLSWGHRALAGLRQAGFSLVSNTVDEKPGIIGRERALVDSLTQTMYRSLRHPLESTSVRGTRRGNYFEVLMADGRVARVEVTLDRIETPENK